jgi:regulator of cell morphogenesis and NO signaling
VNVIERLLEDHRQIMAEIADLRRAVADLDERGDAAVADALPVLGRIGAMMESRLALHARKEDDVLFPALESLFGDDAGPIPVMRAEHREIHGEGERLRATLRELHEVEHPRIEAGGERLRALGATGGSATVLRDNAREIIRLLDQHFGKEEQILFPMALDLLDESALNALGARIEAMSAGAGRD